MSTQAVKPEPVAAPARSIDWLALGWFSALIFLCYQAVLRSLAHQWQWDDDVGHGMFVPFVSAYIAWTRKDEILAIPARPNYWGLALVVWAALQLAVFSVAPELFLQRTAVILAIVGSILLLRGTETVKVLAFPLFLLVFAVPIPGIVYKQITFPLQLLASQLAEISLENLGYPVLREGNILELPGQKLSVVEACSGIRSLLSLSFFSLVYAYFCDNKVWIRSVLFVCTVPIAIVANAGRIVSTGIAGGIDPQLAEGVFHSVSGWVVFVIALVIFMVVHRVINWIYERWMRSRSERGA